MIGSLTEPPIVLRSDGRKTLLRIIGSLGFVAAGVGFIALKATSSTHTNVMMGSCAAFFGILGIRFMVHLVRPLTLVISEHGVRCTSLWDNRHLAWADIAEFRPVTLRSTTMAGFNYAPGHSPPLGMDRFHSDITGIDATLPMGWELDPEPLCDLLNQARKRWGTAAA